jgi:hypothetical protein
MRREFASDPFELNTSTDFSSQRLGPGTHAALKVRRFGPPPHQGRRTQRGRAAAEVFMSRSRCARGPTNPVGIRRYLSVVRRVSAVQR